MLSASEVVLLAVASASAVLLAVYLQSCLWQWHLHRKRCCLPPRWLWQCCPHQQSRSGGIGANGTAADASAVPAEVPSAVAVAEADASASAALLASAVQTRRYSRGITQDRFC